MRRRVRAGLWIDRETGLLLKIEATVGGDGEAAGRAITIIRDNFDELAPGVPMPMRTRSLVAGQPFSTTEVVSVGSFEESPPFDPIATHRVLEVRAQENNEQQYREVIADTDINPAVVEYLRDRVSAPQHNPHDNIECVLNDFDDLGLPADSVDLAFLAGVGLGRFTQPSDTNRAMIDSIARAVRPGGRIAVIENRAQGSRVPTATLGFALLDLDLDDPDLDPIGWPKHAATQGLADEIIVASFEAAGFEFDHASDLIEGQAFLFLRKPR